jgi:two-component system, cell cycle sensor histidine kinase and response regulator CckA
VEDEPMVRRLAVLGLRAHGYTVIEAPDGQTALTIAADSEARIDLVVSDVVMPGMSGPDLGRRLAELRPDAALVLASGHAEAVVLGEATGHGGSRFLQKPFTPELLARKVREVLDAPRQPDGDSD